MASYKLIPLPHSSIDTQTLKHRVKELSALEAEVDLRTGTLPYIFHVFEKGMCYVEYGREDYVERPILKGGTDKTKAADRYPIIFLGNRYGAYDANCSTEIEDKILRIVTGLLEEQIRFEPLLFDEDTLHDVIARSNKVRGSFQQMLGGTPR